MFLKEEVTLDGQTLKLTPIVSRSMGRGLGANLRQLVHRGQPIVADGQVRQVGEVLYSFQACEHIVAKEEFLYFGELEG